MNTPITTRPLRFFVAGELARDLVQDLTRDGRWPHAVPQPALTPERVAELLLEQPELRPLGHSVTGMQALLHLALELAPRVSAAIADRDLAALADDVGRLAGRHVADEHQVVAVQELAELLTVDCRTAADINKDARGV